MCTRKTRIGFQAACLLASVLAPGSFGPVAAAEAITAPSIANGPPPELLGNHTGLSPVAPAPAQKSHTATIVAPATPAPPPAPTAATVPPPAPAPAPQESRPAVAPSAPLSSGNSLAERARQLQEQIDFAEMESVLAGRLKAKRDAEGVSGGAGGSAAESAAPVSRAVVLSPSSTGSVAPSYGPLPEVQRIHLRNGERVAEVTVPGQGRRTLRVGSSLPDGGRIVRITEDDVVVGYERKEVALPATSVAQVLQGSSAAKTIEPAAPSDLPPAPPPGGAVKAAPMLPPMNQTTTQPR